jgi:hypothetical protein
MGQFCSSGWDRNLFVLSSLPDITVWSHFSGEGLAWLDCARGAGSSPVRGAPHNEQVQRAPVTAGAVIR